MTVPRWVKVAVSFFLLTFGTGWMILNYPFESSSTTESSAATSITTEATHLHLDYPPPPELDDVEDDYDNKEEQEDEEVDGVEGGWVKNDNGFREPWIEVHGSYFSPQDCEEIIRLAEEYGFPNTSDSIDYGNERSTVSWSIDVFTNGELLAPTISNVYDKYLPKMFHLVRERKRIMDGDDTEPSLDWVFLRKYQAGAERHMLRMHSDTNLFTVNVALNDNFTGGGIFYQQNKDEYYHDGEPVPSLPDRLYSYEFLESLVERKNQTDKGIVFPNLKQGDMMIHNYTLFHAIAPIQDGTRYSLIFFFDEQHRHVHQNLDEPQRVIIHNLYDMPVDLYWINKGSPELEYVLIDADIPRDPQPYSLAATWTDAFRIKDPRTDEFIFTFYVEKPDVVGDDMVVFIGPDDVLDVLDDYDDVDYDDEDYDNDEDEDFDGEAMVQAEIGKVEDEELDDHVEEGFTEGYKNEGEL